MLTVSWSTCVPTAVFFFKGSVVILRLTPFSSHGISARGRIAADTKVQLSVLIPHWAQVTHLLTPSQHFCTGRVAVATKIKLLVSIPHWSENDMLTHIFVPSQCCYRRD